MGLRSDGCARAFHPAAPDELDVSHVSILLVVLHPQRSEQVMKVEEVAQEVLNMMDNSEETLRYMS